MQNPFEKALKKLDRPPSAVNWVRFAFDTPHACSKAMLSWAFGMPRFTYQPAQVGCKDRIELGIDRHTALNICVRRGSPAGREANASLVEAFFDYDEVRRFSASNPIGFERGFFRISRDIVVPVSPLSVIRERGRFLPIFLCGWANLPLTRFQRRLLMTLYEDAFLSLTDFHGSSAEVLFFPQLLIDGEKVRQPEVWQRGDYDLLSGAELSEAVETFLIGRDIAKRTIRERAAVWTPPRAPPP
jgi:hypothetical protein